MESYDHLVTIDSWNPEELIKIFGDEAKLLKFKQLKLRNHIFLIKLLALYSSPNKNHFEYVAKHYFNQNSVVIDHKLGTEKSF